MVTNIRNLLVTQNKNGDPLSMNNAKNRYNHPFNFNSLCLYNMSGIISHITKVSIRRFAPDTAPVSACGNKQFRTFCNKLYYISNFKDFNTLTLAC